MKISADDFELPDWNEANKGVPMADEPTLPPHKPNTFRTWLPRLWAWLQANPRIVFLTFSHIAAFAVGAWVF